ncbi:MAG: MotA/TolQ/ExbB proton channel family protein [Minwuia sp.]|uniref:MotA/TolQ/ExbB proton channel family protein n=1 Tax=Minwuia sp. TaxID=2493630 RepID=UPI003A869636
MTETAAETPDLVWSGGILDLLTSGGPVVAVLMVLSVAALTIILAKGWQFWLCARSDADAVSDAIGAWRSGARQDALSTLEPLKGPPARVTAAAMRGLGDHLPEDSVREEVRRIGSGDLERLRQWLRPLEVIASLAPLLGLLGTVLGMIEAFRQMELAGSQVDPAVLSGGIWEALLTTAVGLTVAIPTVAALNWFERRAERLAHEMDDAVTRVFTVDLSGGDQEQDNAVRNARPAIVRGGR